MWCHCIQKDQIKQQAVEEAVCAGVFEGRTLAFFL